MNTFALDLSTAFSLARQLGKLLTVHVLSEIYSGIKSVTSLKSVPIFSEHKWYPIGLNKGKMAARLARSRTFKDDPQLRSFYLNNVTATGKTLGIGSYGSVLEVCETNWHIVHWVNT